jgi:hypothetical protein
VPDRDRSSFRLDVRDVVELLGSFSDNRFDVEKLHRFRDPFVYALEVTQGIQYHRADEHLTNADDRGPDNSVELMAYKPAWVRTYVRTGPLGASAEVSGRLIVERMQLVAYRPLWVEVARLDPVAPGVVTTQSRPGYAAERGTIGATLNFVLSDAVMWGTLRLSVELFGTDAPDRVVSTYDESLSVQTWQQLRLRGVMISYAGPDPTVNAANPPQINLPAPTVADLRATAAWTLTVLPVDAQGVFSSAGTLAWSTPLTGVATTPGGCSVQWIALNAAVAAVRMNDGNRTDVIYYGLLPAGTPIANVGGCESSGVSTGPNGQQVTMAHEVGHGAGLAHGPCGTPGDASYPAYEPYDPASTPTASLGEYGLDVSNGQVHRPTEKDLMSYCGPPWISLYHQGRLTNNARLNPTPVRRQRWKEPLYIHPHLWPWEYIPDPPQWERGPHEVVRMKAEQVISIVGVVEHGQLRVTEVTRVTALPQVHDGKRTAFVAELVDDEGRVISAADVQRLPARGCGCGCSGEGESGDDVQDYVFSALLPDIDRGAALRVTGQAADGERAEVWRVEAPGRPVEIYGFEVGLEERTGVARWSLEAPDEGWTAALQFSPDDGRSWNSLAVGITDDGYEFTVEDLPSRADLVFRLLVHDGFSTVTADTRATSAPRPVQLVIMHPQDGAVIGAGQTLRLWASTEGQVLAEEDLGRWYVDEEQVGRGFDDWVVAPAAGEHTVRVECDTEAGTSVAEARFLTVDSE